REGLHARFLQAGGAVSALPREQAKQRRRKDRASAEGDDPGGDAPAFDRELGRRDRQAKPARARASRIDVEDAVALVDRRPVRVARDDDAHAGGARLDVDLGEIVDRVEEDLAEADELALAQALGPRAAV